MILEKLDERPITLKSADVQHYQTVVKPSHHDQNDQISAWEKLAAEHTFGT